MKIDLMTKKEREDLKRLREAHQFYIENRKRKNTEIFCDMLLTYLEAIAVLKKFGKLLREMYL